MGPLSACIKGSLLIYLMQIRAAYQRRKNAWVGKTYEVIQNSEFNVAMLWICGDLCDCDHDQIPVCRVCVSSVQFSRILYRNGLSMCFCPHHICSPRSFFIADRSVDPHKKEMPAKAGGENAVDHTSAFALPFRIWTSVCAILGVFDFMFSDLKESASYEAKGWLICQNF